jgi:hypothetical protein
MKASVCVLACLLASGVCVEGLADGFEAVREGRPEDRVWALDLHFGLATPQGAFGLGVTKEVKEYMDLSLTGGLGATGPHTSVMARLHQGQGLSKVGIGLGATGVTGDFSNEKKEEIGDFILPEFTLWGNIELFYLIESAESGLRFQLYMGYTKRLWESSPLLLVLEGDEEGSRERVSVPTDGLDTLYVGMGAGYAF